MIKKITLLTLMLFSAMLFYDSQYNYVYTNEDGAPSGNTNSPGDGKTCAQTNCHGGSTIDRSGLITHNIGAEGYTPGQTYTFTAQVDTGGSTFGFQVSPQDASGNPLGSITITDATNTKITGGGKYVSHTLAGILGTVPHTWSFEWTAPSAGTGPVTFYGAFNCADGDGTASGDKIFTTSVEIQENQISGISANTTDLGPSLVLYPNPVQDVMNVSFSLDKTTEVDVRLIDINGRTLEVIHQGSYPVGTFQQAVDMRYPSGIYFVRIVKDTQVSSHRVVLL